MSSPGAFGLSLTLLPQRLFLSVLFGLAGVLSVSAQSETVPYPGGKVYLYRLQLSDKHGSPGSLSAPETFLSAKALVRRQRQGLPVDSTDLPLSAQYVSAVQAIAGQTVSRSKWNNTLVVACRERSVLDSLRRLPFVRSMTKVFSSPDSVQRYFRPQAAKAFLRTDSFPQGRYGSAEAQVRHLGGLPLHEAGYRGMGQLIAVIDGGFLNADSIPALQRARIAGVRDFTYHPLGGPFDEIEHGTMVLSTMAVDAPGVYVGTAPEASFLLLRSEQPQVECLAEEDYWAAAAEYADSVGVDIVNTSLGYNLFDDPSSNFRYQQLDGQQTLISRTASMLARKGIVLVGSAGNSGEGTWKKITPPGDADDMLTVGALTPDGLNAPFSSVGPSADGRVKPDVMAYGSPVSVINGKGAIANNRGTSFASPLVCGMVACLWQALPELTACELIELVRRSASQYHTPDNIFGYGTPDFEKAWKEGLLLRSDKQERNNNGQ